MNRDKQIAINARLWSAYCTIHWFATGNLLASNTKNRVISYKLYQWYINIINNLAES